MIELEHDVDGQKPPRKGRSASELPLVLFIDDLARLLGTSKSTIYRALRARTFAIPMLPSIDRKARWSRAAVLAFLNGESAKACPRRGGGG